MKWWHHEKHKDKKDPNEQNIFALKDMNVQSTNISYAADVLQGERGRPGPSGPQGMQGCSGLRGPKVADCSVTLHSDMLSLVLIVCVAALCVSAGLPGPSRKQGECQVTGGRK